MDPAPPPTTSTLSQSVFVFVFLSICVFVFLYLYLSFTVWILHKPPPMTLQQSVPTIFSFSSFNCQHDQLQKQPVYKTQLQTWLFSQYEWCTTPPTLPITIFSRVSSTAGDCNIVMEVILLHQNNVSLVISLVFSRQCLLCQSYTFCNTW